MSKNKLRKVHVNDREFGWTVAGQPGTGKTEVRIWDTATKQIVERMEVDPDTQITPSLVITKIERMIRDEKV